MLRTMNRRLELTVGNAWVAVSLTAILVGSLGPWATLGPFTVNGTAGDGVVALVAGIIGVMAVLVPRIPTLVTVAAAIASAAVAAYDLAAIVAAETTILGSVAPGWGILAVLLGGGSLGAWALVQEPARRQWVRVGVSVVALLLVGGAGAAGALGGSADTPEEADTPVVTTESDPELPIEPSAEPEPAVPQTAEVGEALTLTGSDVTVRVTVRGVRDPLPAGEFDSVATGKRMVGVELRLTNQSASATYDDSPSNGAKLIYGNDVQADSAFAFGGCEAQSLTIAPGDSRRVCIPFEVGANNSLKTFQFALDSGFSDDRGEWHVNSNARSSTGGAGPPPEASLTSCDQNISAGPKTTCGFANAVFVEYARLLQAGEVESSVSLSAKSPANDRTYSVTCEVIDREDVQCRAGDGAYVTFPQAAASVY